MTGKTWVCALLALVLLLPASLLAQDENEELFAAAHSGNLWWVKALLAAGADVNAKDEVFGRTALMIASGANESGEAHTEIVSLLIEAGADVNAKDEVFGRTALMIASGTEKSGEAHTEVVSLLIEAGADVDAQNSLALHWATLYGHADIVSLLLEADADVDAQFIRGATALQLASTSGYADIVSLLLEAGADVEAQHDDGTTALQWASLSGHVDIVSLLLEAGADVEAQDNDGNTAMYWAILMGHADIISLLEAGSDPATAGITPLMIAALQGDSPTLIRLLRSESDADRSAALRYAVHSGDPTIVSMLLAAGADPHWRDKITGRTALDWAEAADYEEIIALLKAAMGR